MKKSFTILVLLIAALALGGAAVGVTALIQADTPKIILTNQDMAVSPLDPIVTETSYTARYAVTVTTDYEVRTEIKPVGQ